MVAQLKRSLTPAMVDIKKVAAGTADGAFYNNGQSCCAVERIYVHEKIYDRYVDEFISEVKSWKTEILSKQVFISALSVERIN